MSTNLHIDDIGNLILRDGKLGLCVSSQYVAPPHYGGGRVGALCPYVYCADNPVNCVDPDGRDVLPTSEEAYQMILMTIPEVARDFVQCGENGCIDRDLINSFDCLIEI